MMNVILIIILNNSYIMLSNLIEILNNRYFKKISIYMFNSLKAYGYSENSEKTVDLTEDKICINTFLIFNHRAKNNNIKNFQNDHQI